MNITDNKIDKQVIIRTNHPAVTERWDFSAKPSKIKEQTLKYPQYRQGYLKSANKQTVGDYFF
ncbi:MAG: hypothetical protein LBG15_12660 [Dysgonamonadaceae bacterium]|jgi:hypothetical protein|nr:hypothetical protein [Dysgonamonadaceae bacterium]